MPEDKLHWNNEEIFREVFDDILRRIKEDAAKKILLENFREALAKQDSTDLQDLLIEMQLRPLYNLMYWLDGAVGPSIWPGVKLVNEQTGEPLSIDYGIEFAGVVREALYDD